MLDRDELARNDLAPDGPRVRGAPHGHALAATVAVQAAWATVLALGFATAASFALGVAIDALTPNVSVVIQPASVIRVGLGAVVVGALASLLPLRRVVRVDPATAFRRPA